MNRNPRILIVTTVPETIYRLLSSSISRLKNSKYDVLAATSSESWIDVSDLSEDLGIEIFKISLSRAFKPSKDLTAFFELRKLIREKRPDIVHAHTPKAGLVAALCAPLFTDVKFVYTVRGLPFETQTGLKRWALIRSEKFTCRQADVVFSVSKSVANVLDNLNICKAKDIKICGKHGSAQGVDSAVRFNPACIKNENFRVKLGIERDKLVIGFVGRLTNDKGIESLAEIWSEVDQTKTALIVVGAKDSARYSTNLKVDKFYEDKKVCFVGRNESVEQYMSLFDILLFPSKREGFPNVVLECAALRVPTIAWKVTGCIDAILDGETGWLFEEDSNESVVRLIGDLHNNRGLIRDLGDQARTRVKLHFKPEVRIQELIDSYKSLLAG